MRLHRGMWAGACLLLALVGCGKNDKTIKDVGVYAPILTGISSNHEPAARGAANLLTAQVTNVNNIPLRYHWSVQAGTLPDSTSGTVTWTPPDSIATYSVTVSIEGDDGGKHFFKTLTVPMSVDNEFTRWTNTETIKFDPAPTTGGGVMYAEFINPTTKSSNVYRVTSPLAGPVSLTTGFFSVISPTPRADLANFAFAARLAPSDSASIYFLPFGGGDASTATFVEGRKRSQHILTTPRYPWFGSLLAYVSDSVCFTAGGGVTVFNYHDTANLSFPRPVIDTLSVDPILKQNGIFLRNPSWGPDGNGDGTPDSIMGLGIQFPGTFAEQIRGIIIAPIVPPFGTTSVLEWSLGADIRDPDWSPDGRYVVFTMKNPGTNDRDIWIINRAAADISQAVRVTYGPADDSQPRFSSNGDTIFFVSNRVDRYGVTGVFGTQRRGTNIWSVSQFDRP